MNNVTELIKVTGVSPYSVFSGSTRYSFNKGIDSSMFQKGHTYGVTVNVGSKGGKYISKIDSDLGLINAEPARPSVLNPSTNQLDGGVARPVNEYGKPVSDYAIAKDVRISRSGVIQAAVQAVAPHISTSDAILPEAIKLAEGMLAWVTQVKENE